MAFPDKSHRRETEPAPKTTTMPSEDLAAIIVDALLRASVVNERDVKRAVKIVVEEIDVRKALGDY
jgi:hypothetical protein